MTNKFNCTQQELYLVCLACWNSCSEYIDQFTLVSPKFTPVLIDTKKTEILALARTPDSFRRSAEQENLRLALADAHEKCVAGWRKLQHYIEAVWKGQEQKNMLKSAGQVHYRAAINQNWKSCQAMLHSATEFLALQADKLGQDNNMPPGFQTEFTALADAYAASLQAYTNAGEQAPAKTADRTAANNKLYTELKSMLKIGRDIFRKNPEIRTRFSFDEVLTRISGPGVAGIKGAISVAAGTVQSPSSTDANLQITLQENGDEAFVEDGAYRFSQLAAGTYTLVVKSTGYKEQVIPGVVVNIGTYTTRDILLEPEAK